MTRIEIQTEIFKGLKENLETLEHFNVKLVSFPGSIKVWPLVNYEREEELQRSREQTLYEMIEEYVHTYGSNVIITYTEEAMELTF